MKQNPPLTLSDNTGVFNDAKKPMIPPTILF